MAVGVIVQTVATNVGTFMAARFILGFGIPFAIGGASMLIAELVYPKHTSVINGLFNEVGFHILPFFPLKSDSMCKLTQCIVLVCWSHYRRRHNAGDLCTKGQLGVADSLHRPDRPVPTPTILHLVHSRVPTLAHRP